MPDAQAETAALTISRFDKALHDRSAFSCGYEPIDRFLKEALSDHIKAGYLAAYMATECEQRHVIGFYTLGAFAVVPADIVVPRRPRPPEIIPATYIKAVAVHKDWQGKGIGTALVIHALRNAAKASEEIGSMAVVLDVLNDEFYIRRLEFYNRLGFQRMNDPDNIDRIYISMKDIRATLGA